MENTRFFAVYPVWPLSSRFRFALRATLPTERAPFVALRHFPRFIGEIYPEGESKSIRIRVNITLPSKISLPQAISLRNAKFHLSSGKYRCRNAGRRGVVPYGWTLTCRKVISNHSLLPQYFCTPCVSNFWGALQTILAFPSGESGFYEQSE